MNKKSQMASNIKKLIIPLNEGAVMLLKNAAKDVTPMAGCGIVHKKCEVEWKKEATNAVNKPYKKKMKVSIEMELIANFLSCRKSNVSKPS